MALIGSVGLTVNFPLGDQVVNSLPLDVLKGEDGKMIVPATLITNAQVSDAGELTDPKQVALALKLMYGVNLQFQGYFKRGDVAERNPLTGRMTRKNVQTEKLEPKGWMFFATGGRVNGAVAIPEDILKAVQDAKK